jgi:hypothetical protein
MASIIKVDQIQTAAGGTPTAADLGINTTGNVLQVVQGEYSAEQDTGSTSFVSTGLTATITPSSTSSKILILVSLAGSGAYAVGSGDATAIYSIYDGTSHITNVAHRVNDYGGSGVFSMSNHAINYLHSPATTNAKTYTVYHKLGGGDSSRVFNDSGGKSKGTITLIEIAG